MSFNQNVRVDPRRLIISKRNRKVRPYWELRVLVLDALITFTTVSDSHQ